MIGANISKAALLRIIRQLAVRRGSSWRAHGALTVNVKLMQNTKHCVTGTAWIRIGLSGR
jgi:hypothetical protein